MKHGDAGKSRCWSCGHPVGPDAENCDDCGSMLLALCEGCGSTQSVFARECTECGAGLNPRSYQPPRRARPIILIALALLIIGGAAAFLIIRANSESSFQVLEDAIYDYRSGRFQPASVKLRSYNQRWPGSARALYMLAASLYSMEQRDEAAEFARQALEVNPDLPEPRLILAACALDSDDAHGAREHAIRILSRPASLLKADARAKAHLILGKAYSRPGILDMRRAGVHLQTAVDTGLAEDPEAWLLLAEIDLARRAAGVDGPSEAKSELALARANEVAMRRSQNAPKDIDLLFLRARIHFARGEIEEAYKKFHDVPHESRSPVHHVFQARLSARLGQGADAHIALEKALQSEVPSDYLAVSDAYREMGEIDRAEEVLTAAREEFPDDLGVVLRATDRLLRQGRYEEAEKLAVAGLDEHEENDLLTVARADALARQPGRRRQAERVLREHPGGPNSECWLRLADYLLDTPSDAPDCEERIREAERRLDAGDAEGVQLLSLYRQFLRGKLALRRNHLDEAIAILSEVALRTPTDGATHRLLAHTFGRRREYAMQAREIGAVIGIEGANPALLAARAEAWLRAGYRKRAMEDLDALLVERPEHHRALLLLADAQLDEDRDDPTRALETLTRLRDLPGSGMEARLRIGQILAQKGDFDGAELAILEGREIARTDAERLDATEALARVRAVRGGRIDAQESRRTWLEFIEKHPESISGPLRYAATLLDAGARVEAMRQIDRVLERHPDTVAALRLRFEGCLLAKDAESPDIEGAKDAAAHLARIVPDGPADRYLRGRLALLAGDREEGTRLLVAAGERDPADSRIAYFEALALAEADDRPGAAAALIRALASEPNLRSARELLARVHISWAQALIEEDRQKEAIDLLTRALDGSPQSIPLRALLAKALYHAGISVRSSLLADARTYCEALLAELDERSDATERDLLASARLLHAAILMAQRDWVAAAEAFSRHLHLAPDSVLSLRRRGICLVRAGRFDDAVVSLKSAYALAPDDFPLLVDLLNACGAAGRETEAARLMTRRLDRYPDDAAARTLLGRILERRGEKERAEALYREAVRTDPNHLPAADWLVDLLVEASRDADAARFTRDLKARTDRKADVGVLLGHVLLHSDPRSAEAEALLRAAVKSGTEDGEVWLRALNLLLGILRDTGRAQEAAAFEVTFGDWLRVNREALLTGPLAAPAAYAWFQLGLAHVRSGSDPRAEFCYRRALVIVPNYPDALNNLAGLLGREAMKRPDPRRTDMLDEAESLARKATRLDPDRPEAHDTLGEILLRAGKAGEALTPFTTALALARADGEQMAWVVPWVLIHRAEAELALERRADARRTLAEAIELDPNLREDPSVKNLESRLR